MITKISSKMFVKNFKILRSRSISSKTGCLEYPVYKTEQDFLDVGIDQEFLDWAIKNNFISYWNKGEKYYVNLYKNPNSRYSGPCLGELYSFTNYFYVEEE